PKAARTVLSDILGNNPEREAAVVEHEAAMVLWHEREVAAKIASGYRQAQTELGATGDEVERLREAIFDTPATTVAELQIKARVAEASGDPDLASQVVAELAEFVAVRQ